MMESFQAADFTKAASIYDASPGRSKPVEAVVLRARVFLKTDPPKTIELLLNELRRPPEISDRSRGEMLMVLAMAYALIREFDISDDHFEKARRIAAQSKDMLLLAEILYRRGRCRLMRGRIVEAKADLRVLLNTPGERAAIWSLHLESFIQSHEEQYHDQLHTLVKLLEVLDASFTADIEMWAWATHTVGGLCRELYIPDAVSFLERQISRNRWPEDLAVNHFQAVKALGWCRALQGDYFNAFRHLKIASQVAPTDAWRAIATIDRAHIARCINEHRWSRQELAEAEALCDKVDWKFVNGEERIGLVLMAELFAGIDPSRAASYLAKHSSLGELHAPLLHFSYDDRLKALIAYVQGVVQVSLGNRSQAAKPIRQSCQVFDRIGYHWRAGQSALRLHEITRESKLIDFAEEKLRHYMNCWLGDELRTVHHDRDGGDGRLTPMQDRIFKLICLGKSTKDIALELGRSQFTVRNHVKLILKAFNVKTRQALLAKAVKRGLVGGWSAGAVGRDRPARGPSVNS